MKNTFDFSEVGDLMEFAPRPGFKFLGNACCLKVRLQVEIIHNVATLVCRCDDHPPAYYRNGNRIGIVT